MVGRGLQHNHSCSRQCALLPCRLTDSKWRFYFCASLAGRASLCGKERSQQHVPGCIQGDIPAEQTQLSWESLDSGQSLDLLAWSMCSQAVNKHAWVGMRVRARERAHARTHTHTHTHTHSESSSVATSCYIPILQLHQIICLPGMHNVFFIPW